MPSDRMGRPARGAVVLAAIVLAAGACTASDEPLPQPDRTEAPPPVLTGHLFGPVPRSGLTEVAMVDLATGEVTDVEGADFVGNSFLSGAVWGSDGSAYITVDREVEQISLFRSRFVTQLVAVAPDGTAAPVGPELQAGGQVLAERDGVVYALRCGKRPGIVALDLAAPDTWRPVAEGCPGALSPDRSSAVTVVRDEGGTRVVVTSLEDGTTSTLARLEDLQELRNMAGLARPPVQMVAWGSRGIALIAGRNLQGGDRYALVVLPDGEAPRVHALGGTLTGGIEWQPEGTLLAIQECRGCESFRRLGRGEVRLYDIGTDSFLQVAGSEARFGGLAWSPDGTSLVVAWRDDEVVVIDPSGKDLGRVEVAVEPWAWTA